MKKIGAIILGGSGYGVGELLRYLVFHAEVEVVAVTSASNVGERIEDLHPHLSGFYPNLACTAEVDLSLLSKFQYGVVFSSLPHGTSSVELGKILEKNIPANIHLIDLSGDLRLQDEETHLQHYPDIKFEKSLRSKFEYIIPEINQSELKGHISNPGCLSTAGAIALFPLTKLPLKGSVYIDAKTGTSGGGRSPQASFHHPHRHGNLIAYKVLSHRHEPEIRQATGLTAKVDLAFVPHLLPVSRGILVTLYATLEDKNLSQRELEDHFKKVYSGSYFVRYRKQTPSLHDVVGTNFVDLSVNIRDHQVVVIAALDNMGKGMAGQAIQNMNLVCGLDQSSGLKVPALGLS
jgi:N-acetyl-gamma-glutamyl-phosphate reductase common form